MTYPAEQGLTDGRTLEICTLHVRCSLADPSPPISSPPFHLSPRVHVYCGWAAGMRRDWGADPGGPDRGRRGFRVYEVGLAGECRSDGGRDMAPSFLTAHPRRGHHAHARTCPPLYRPRSLGHGRVARRRGERGRPGPCAVVRLHSGHLRHLFCPGSGGGRVLANGSPRQ